MGMLRVAMRQRIEFGGAARGPNRDVVARWDAWFVLVLVLSVGLVLTVRPAHAEHFTHHRSGQSVSSLGSGPHTVSPRGIPPHAPGYLGILFKDSSDKQVSSLHLQGARGVEVMMVDHDGPAGKAGLRVHDVIVSLNGQVLSGGYQLGRMIHDAGVGAEIALGVIRDGRQVAVNAQLAYRGEVEREALAKVALPDRVNDDGDPVVSGFVEGYDAPPAASVRAGHGTGFLLQILHNTPFTGLALEAMEPQLAMYFGSSTGGGLLVETVVPDSPASQVGVRAGDVVLRVDSIVVKSTAEWSKRLHAGKGRAVVLTVLRDRREQTITLIPDAKRHSEVMWPEARCHQPMSA